VIKRARCPGAERGVAGSPGREAAARFLPFDSILHHPTSRLLLEGVFNGLFLQKNCQKSLYLERGECIEVLSKERRRELRLA